MSTKALILTQGNIAKRKLTPQRVHAPVGLLARGVARAQDQSTMSAALFRLSSCAQVLMEPWPDHLHGFALVWGGSDRHHGQTWKTFVETVERVTEEVLLRDFFILHRQTGPPAYNRFLFFAGDSVCSTLPLFENFVNYMRSQGSPIQHVRLGNLTGEDLTRWSNESTLPDLLVTEDNPSDFSPFHLLDRKASLMVSVENTQEQPTLQLVLAWVCVGLEDFVAKLGRRLRRFCRLCRGKRPRFLSTMVRRISCE